MSETTSVIWLSFLAGIGAAPACPIARVTRAAAGSEVSILLRVMLISIIRFTGALDSINSLARRHPLHPAPKRNTVSFRIERRGLHAVAPSHRPARFAPRAKCYRRRSTHREGRRNRQRQGKRD